MVGSVGGSDQSGEEVLLVLFVDDEEAAVHSLTRALKRHRICVRGMSSAQQVLAPGAADGYDAILLDVGLGPDSGLDVCKRLRARGCTKPILMLSGDDDVELRIRALGPEVQADDYLLKPMIPAEIAARTRAVRRRSSRPPTPPLELSAGGRSVRVEGDLIPLTPFEGRLLLCLVEAKGEILGFEQLQAVNKQKERHACEQLVHRLRRKLGKAGPRLVTINGVGCLFRM